MDGSPDDAHDAAGGNDAEIVATLREARQLAVARSAQGGLAQVLAADADDPRSRTYVVKLLDVHPALGKVVGRRLLSEVGVDPFARVVDLSDAQKQEILRACGEST